MDGLTPRRWGVLGGTFDPVHIGHLMAAAEAASALALSRVLFVPARQPPHKPADGLSAAEHRLAMLELAVAEEPAFAVSRIDLDRPGPHYTVDLLRALRREASLADGEALWFVMGADSLQDLPTWRDPETLVRLARLAVLGRPGYEPDMAALARVVPGVREAVDRLEMPLVGVSGTDLRRRVAEGRTIHYQVPRTVERYIARHGLYRSTGP